MGGAMSQGMGMGMGRLQTNRFQRLGAGCCRATEGIIGTDGGYMPEQMILDLNGEIPSVTSCRRACKSYGDACFGFEVDRHRGHPKCELQLGPVMYASRESRTCRTSRISCHRRTPTSESISCPADISFEAGSNAMWAGVGQAAVIAAPVTIAGNTDLVIQTRNEGFMFTPIAAGNYTIEHTDDGSSCTFVLTVTVPVAQANGLRVEIIWDTATDMDSWMLRPGAAVWAGTESLYYDNLVPPGFAPYSQDSQPTLDVDSGSFGPENMNIVAPQVGATYAIAVHAYRGNAAAQVRIFCGGNLQTEFAPFALTNRQFWHAADVTFAADNSCTVVSRDNVYPESPTATTYPR